MKRHGNLFSKIVDIDNLRLAHKLAQRGKQHYTAVKQINKDPDKYLLKIHEMLVSGTFTTSPYKSERRFDGGKWRVIHKLPYFPDRIVQHALMNIVAPIWKKSFIRDTFQSIEGRGTHDARRRIEKYLRLNPHQHAIKIDIQQYYPSVPNDKMKSCVRHTIKCERTLALIDNIIDSHCGLPIGNYTSQYFGNLYLTMFDWWVKQTVRLKGYFRYCDDIVFMHGNSTYLHKILLSAIDKLQQLGLSIKNTIAYRYVCKHGLDFCGFVFYETHTKLRKKIENNIKKCAKQTDSEKLLRSLMSYWGWIKFIDAKAFWKNIITPNILAYTDNVYSNNPLRRTV